MNDESIRAAFDELEKDLNREVIQPLKQSLAETEKERLRLTKKYETPGICGYIHGVEKPEVQCKHVLWAKARQAEIKRLREGIGKHRSKNGAFGDSVDHTLWNLLEPEKEGGKG